MKNFTLALLVFCATNAFAQMQPVTTYDGGDLYFVPAQLTSEGKAFLYSYKWDYNSSKSWFTIFDDNVNVVKYAEIEPQILEYKKRTVVTERKYFQGKQVVDGVSEEVGYFLDDWTQTSDVTEDCMLKNCDILAPEVYEDNNNYHSRELYISQTLFNDDEDFEFLRCHYEIMPLSYCASDDKSDGSISLEKPSFGGEECDEYTYEYDSEKNGLVFTLIRRKIYGGLKGTGLDIVSLDGSIKKTIEGITYIGTCVAINGNYYVSAYDGNSSKYALYKIATATTSLAKVADISGKTWNNITYNFAGIKVNPETKGVVIRNGRKIINK